MQKEENAGRCLNVQAEGGKEGGIREATETHAVLLSTSPYAWGTEEKKERGREITAAV